MTNNILAFFTPPKPEELVKSSININMFPFDVGTMMETQRKNMMAFSRAQQLAIESLQVITSRQAAMLSDLAADQATLSREIMESGKPEEKIADQAMIIRDLYERSIAHLREIGDMITHSSQETADVIHNRIAGSLSEMKDAIKKSSSRRTA